MNSSCTTLENYHLDHCTSTLTRLTLLWLPNLTTFYEILEQLHQLEELTIIYCFSLIPVEIKLIRDYCSYRNIQFNYQQ